MILDHIFKPSYPNLKTCIVNLKHDDLAFRGVIYRSIGEFIVVRNAEIVADKKNIGKSRIVDGEVLIFKRDISFVQIL